MKQNPNYDPNSQKLFFMLNSGLLMYKVSYSFKHVHFYCSTCKLGKSKVLHFTTRDDNSTDSNRLTWIYLLHAKSEVFDAL